MSKLDGILAIQRNPHDSDEIEAILVSARKGSTVEVVRLGSYKTNPKAKAVVDEMGPPGHFDKRTSEAKWVDVNSTRRLLGI